MTEHHHEHPGDFEQGVMVDVGPGAGALVIYTAEAMLGEEIEISPQGRDQARTHTEVLRRRAGGDRVCAAVFGTLPEGHYLLWHPSRPEPTEVRVESGKVVELDWR